MFIRRLQKLTPIASIALGYFAIICVGAFLLCMPFASAARTFTPPLTALFTATSATCVTGLVVVETATYWSLAGQIIILLLIQIGGIGFMTVAILSAMLIKRRIGLHQRYIMSESVSAPQVGGIVRMTKFILYNTLAFEGAGALLLCIRTIPRFGFWRGLYYGIFHSVSAFCNAGFAIFPEESLLGYQGDWLVNLTIIALIVVGGLGFFVWADIEKQKWRFRRLNLHSKMVLSTTAILLFGGAALFLLLEWEAGTYEGMTLSEKIIVSFFQSATTRTAGFNSISQAALSQPGRALSIVLMLIGGSPGSTAGGMKTTTFAIMTLSIFSELRRKRSVECFGRRVDEESLKHACSVMMLYVLMVLIAMLAISAVDNFTAQESLFECVSAIATVGLTLGITTELSAASQLIIIFLMYLGRVGGMTILFAFTRPRLTTPSQLPQEKITVG